MQVGDGIHGKNIWVHLYRWSIPTKKDCLQKKKHMITLQAMVSGPFKNGLAINLNDFQ